MAVDLNITAMQNQLYGRSNKYGTAGYLGDPWYVQKTYIGIARIKLHQKIEDKGRTKKRRSDRVLVKLLAMEQLAQLIGK